MIHRQLLSALTSSALLAAVAIVGTAWSASPALALSQAKEDHAQTRELREDDLKGLTWRSVGPANMAGRVAAIAVEPGDPKTYYIGYATGGVWKTTNGGTTYSPIFDTYETSSIGSIAVADAPANWPGWEDSDVPEDERAEKGKGKIIWVGTGEGNGRNSSSWGHGVYRSTDGGATFEHTGLADSHDIPAIVVHPDDPDVCFVAALGHLWGPNEMRGVYRTTDGGETWDAVLQINEDVGAIDLVIDPEKPEILHAAMYQRRRALWSYQSGGEEGGIYRSTDGGETWTKTTAGLPEQTGRIGLDVAQSDPRIVYAVVESNEGGWIGSPFTNRQREGGVFRSDDRGTTWERVSDFNPRSFYFSTICVDPTNPEKVYLLGWQVYVSDDGGRTFRAGLAKKLHVDHHAMWINPDDPDHIIDGNDGGLYVTYDGGKAWDFHNHMAVGQFYNVAVDERDPYRVGGGLQDNGSWIGPSETVRNASGEWSREGSIWNGDWIDIWGGDGFHVAFCPEDPNIVYAESQGGEIGRIHLDTGEKYRIQPSPKEGEPRMRWNWNAPFFVSPHEPTRLYIAGNSVFRLDEKGDRWERISKDLSRNEVEKVTTVGSDAETYGTVVSLAESPMAEGMLWAGTDDGLIHVTTDGGESWNDVTPDVVDGRYISKIEPSHHDQDTAYIAIDGHWSDDFAPLLLMTTDAGETWSDITANLPDGGTTMVIREDQENPDVLYVGTERAAWISIDRGDRWVKLNCDDLPTVPVDDLKIQRTRQDLVAGTHGRSIWILDDITPLSQLTDEVLRKALHVFEPRPALPRYRLDLGAMYGDRGFVAKNPPMGAIITYWLRDDVNEEVKVTITDGDGRKIRELAGTGRPGLNRVVWDLQAEEKQRLGNPHRLPEFVPAGAYTVKVSYKVDEETHESRTTVEVREAPGESDGEGE